MKMIMKSSYEARTLSYRGSIGHRRLLLITLRSNEIISFRIDTKVELINMDVHGAGVVAVLGTVGAATGAISAVIVYTICTRRRRLPLLASGVGPLNWSVISSNAIGFDFSLKLYPLHVYLPSIVYFRFEKDLLNRAEEAARSSKDVLVGLGSSVSLGRDSRTPKHSASRSDDEEWQSDHVFDSIASDSPRKRE